MIDEERFANGGFSSDIMLSYTQNHQLVCKKWVVKNYQDGATKSITDELNISVEDHTRKQVQIHAVARSMAKHFSKKIPVQFGDNCLYKKTLNSTLKDLPVTVEEFVPEQFIKYINTNSKVNLNPSNDMEEELFAKAEFFAHFHCFALRERAYAA